MKNSFILGISALMATTALADTTVQGTIRDAHTQQPLAGVYVQAFSDKKIASMTDSTGQYIIVLPDHVKSLRIVRAGYNAQQIPLSGRQTDVDAALYPATFTDKVGLSNSAQTSLTANVSDLTTDASADNQIASTLSGQLRTVTRGGVPGMGAFTLINGINSLHVNTQPLVVVDGIILDMQYGREAKHDGFYNNLLANISVDDIASVKVLRNGTAIYGAKGANGVILIETKRSHSYDTRIDVNISGAFEQVPTLPDMMNASEYRTYASELLGTTGVEANEFVFLREDPNYYYYKVYHNNTDWKKEVYDEAFAQRYSINVQGGDDAADYNISLGYIKSEATLKKNDMSRFNLRINSDLKLASWMNVRLDASYSDVNRNMRNDGAPDDIDNAVITAPGFLGLIKSPFLSPYQYDTRGVLSDYLADADNYLSSVLYDRTGEGRLANPTAILTYGEGRNKNSFGSRMVTLSLTPTAKFDHNLTLSDNFSFVLFNTDEGNYVPVFGVPYYELPKVTQPLRNTLQSASSRQYLLCNDLRLNWQYVKQGHRLNLDGGFRYAVNTYQGNGLTAYNSGNDNIPDINKDLTYRKSDGVNEKVTSLTYYASANYGLWDKYFIDAAMSLEANTRFGKDADHALKMFDVAWGVFPSVGASWVVTNEDWMPANRWLNYLRINAAWDLTGNDDVDLNASRTYFKSVKVFNESGVGTVLGGIGNTSLKWETTKRLSWGAEANLVDNRVSLAVNAYKGWTSDMLSKQALNYLVGFDSNWSNKGKIENTGFDIEVQGKVINTRDWQWQLGFSVGHYKNEVTELPSGDFLTEAYGGNIATMVGHPVGLFYGYQTDGVYSTSAEAASDGKCIVLRTGEKQYFEAGDMRFIDHDGNDIINDADRVVIGNPNPDIYGNITSHLQWRKLALDVVFNYSLGNDVYNYQRSLLEAGSRFHNQTTAMRSRWSSEGQQTDMPRIAYGDPMGNSRFSDRWIEDGSYLRLKNIRLSYTWDFYSRYLQGITVWGGVQNLFTLTKYLGSDPEFSASNNVLLQGIDRGLLPMSRNFSAGVKINL